jgi:hypothetical protein
MRRVKVDSTTIGLVYIFNAVIDSLDLREIEMVGRNGWETVYMDKQSPRAQLREIRSRTDELKLGTKISYGPLFLG